MSFSLPAKIASRSFTVTHPQPEAFDMLFQRPCFPGFLVFDALSCKCLHQFLAGRWFRILLFIMSWIYFKYRFTVSVVNKNLALVVGLAVFIDSF